MKLDTNNILVDNMITISNILRGYYYGLKDATVPAIGQVIEQVFRILFVYILINHIKKK